jgi:hypothetical protein
MLISILAITVILLGVVLYCWHLRKQQHKLINLVKLMEHLQKPKTLPYISNKKAA